MFYTMLSKKKIKEYSKLDIRVLMKLYAGGKLAHVCKGGEVVGYTYEDQEVDYD